MKKWCKRTLGLWLCMMLVMLGLAGSTVFAGPTNGTIKVTGVTEGKTYSIYKILDLTYTGSGANKQVSYTIAPEWVNFFTTGNGVPYLVASDPTGTLNQIMVGGVVKYLNITAANVAEFSKVATGEISKTTIPRKGTQVCPTGATEITFTGLELGYYLVHPEGATSKKTGQESIVSLTSTTPDGEVQVKAEYPSITKEVNKRSVDYGEEVTYTLKSKVPDITGYDTYFYEITDTLSKGLTFVDSPAPSITVEIDGAAQTVSAGATGNIHYTTSTNPVAGGNETILKINFDMKQFQTLKEQEIVITYKAKLNKDAVIGNAGNPNTVQLEYSRDPKDSTKKDKTPPQTKQVYTGKIKVIKHKDGDEGTKLADAEFVLYKEEGGVKKYYKLNVTPAPPAAPTSKVISWEASEADATVLKTDAAGELDFEGLKAGTYQLKETKAPTGYNLLADPIAVTLNDTEGPTLKMEAESKVANKSGVELPKTGGSGTLIFGVLGAGLAAIALFSLGKDRWKSRKGKK